MNKQMSLFLKRSVNILCLLCFLCCTSLSLSAANSRQERVSFYPEKPRANEQMKILYDPVEGDLEYSDEVKTVLYILRGNRWDVEQLAMVRKAGKWEVEFTLPDNSSFLALKFIQGDLDRPDIVDNNDDKGYFLAIRDREGKARPGNTIGQAILLAPHVYGGALNSYYTSPPAPQPKLIAELLKEEDKISGAEKAGFLVPYLKLQQIALGSGFDKFASAFLDKELAKKQLPEDYLSDLYFAYYFSLRDSILGPQIGDRILKEYPKSNSARFVSFGRVRTSGPDVYENIASIEKFLKEYPISEWRKQPDEKGFMYYTLYRVLGSSYFDTRQFDKFTDLYKEELDFKTGNELARWNVLRAYMSNSLGKDTLYQVSSRVMPYLLANRNDNSFFDDFSTSAEAARKVAINQLDDRLATHISLLYDLGKYEEARTFFFELSEEGKYATAELNEINLHIIEKLNLQNEVLSYLEMCVKYNAVTPEMLDRLKEIYLRKHGDDGKGFDEYITSLKSDEEKEAMRRYVESHITDYPMPDFELESADGSMVSSGQLKDKIVVIDFWATWCRPCIMALPGMQLVTDKFAQDPRVRVYLVGTMQAGDYKNKSVNFIRESGYRFNMLHDAVNPATGEQDLLFRKVAPFFDSSGIPRKIIVKNGVIRYSSEGYSGSPSKLLDEISLVIEMLKNEE